MCAKIRPDSSANPTSGRRVYTMSVRLFLSRRSFAKKLVALDSSQAQFASQARQGKQLPDERRLVKRILLDCPQMALYLGQGTSFSRMARLLLVTERCARDPVTRDPLGKGRVIDLARMFKFA